MSLLVKVRTAYALGVLNLWRVLLYRFGVKTGLNAVRRLSAELPSGPFFDVSRVPVSASAASLPVNWLTSLNYFGAFELPITVSPPAWHTNPISGCAVVEPKRAWWKIPDFDGRVGDIKTVWEASRFDWVLALAQHAVSGEREALTRLEAWLTDWCKANAPYLGPNWKCGQEASIRVMHLAMAARLLGQHAVTADALLDLIDLHLQRIAPTISYAVAQDNNHGTSEAAALFIGGSWLASQRPASRGKRWAAMGRKWLENRVQRLVMPDGSFSQYSANYHRVMLDTLNMAELWRRELSLPLFSTLFQERAKAATEWLRYLTRENGDVPNLGANDGARLLPLSATDYRDYRPSVQLASVLFSGKAAYSAEGSWNEPLRWLGLKVPAGLMPATASRLFDDGGYACLMKERAFALLRYPRFRFRPSQADALHVDFWLGGRNILRDAGSYSYNTEPVWLNYFPGTASHNTVQFDDRDQMPRLSRFLFGNWLNVAGKPAFSSSLERDCVEVAYRDGRGARHGRKVTLEAGRLVVDDQVSGFRNKAVVRWRLMPGDWRQEGNVWRNGNLRLSISTELPVQRMAVVQGWESRYYLQKTPLPVLEIEVNRPGAIRSVIEWDS